MKLSKFGKKSVACIFIAVILAVSAGGGIKAHAYSKVSINNATIADLYLKNSDYNNAVKYYTLAIKESPKNTSLYLNRAAAYIKLNKSNLAMADYKKALAINPKLILDNKKMGDLFYAAKDYNSALYYYKRLKNMAGVSKDVYFELGKVLEKQGKHLNAAEAFTIALSIDKKNPDYYYYKGISMLALLNYNEAIKDFQLAVFYKKDYNDAYLKLADTFYASKDYKSAVENYAICVNNKYDELYCYMKTGYAYKALNSRKEAIDAFTNALSIDQNNFDAYKERGNLYHQIPYYDKSLDDGLKAVEIKDDEEVWQRLSDDYMHLNQLSKAMESINKTISINSKNFEAYRQRGLLNLKLSNTDKAYSDFNTMVSLNGSSTDAYVLRGISLKNLQKYNDSYDDFTTAIKLNPLNAEAYYYRSIVELKLNQRYNADMDLKKAEEIDSSIKVKATL